MPPVGAVRDRDLQAEQVAQLPLERRDVGLAPLYSIGGRRCAARLAGLGQLLGLAHREAAADHLLGQRLRIGAR